MVRAFVRAVFVGTMAASIVPTIFTMLISLLMLGEPQTSLSDLLWNIALPTLLAAMFVVPASVLIGLPLTWALVCTDREREEIYTAAGAIIGGSIIVALAMTFELRGVWWAVALGAFSGGITGWDWGRSRATLSA